MKRIFIFATLMIGLFYGCSSPESSFDVDHAIDYCDRQVHRSLEQLHQMNGALVYTLMPRNIMEGRNAWHCKRVAGEEWCSGFWPGVLWYTFEATGDEKIKAEAEKYTASLNEVLDAPVFDHDLGHIVNSSYGNGFRLTKNPKYKQMMLRAADSLATLFNPRVGTMLSWPRNFAMYGGHNTIVNNLMNLELLFWAAKNGGNPKLAEIAKSHADKNMKYQFRPDYNSYHVTVYDTLTGEFLRGCTNQGYSDKSMWARGQAWAIYGYTMVYRETKDIRYLRFVQKVADTYLTRLPEDYVPYWDFDDPQIPDAPKDASAAAISASALIELSSYVPSNKALAYKEAALKMLESLSSSKYQSREANPAFLNHSTGNWPAGSEINTSIIYADYYYIEALLRLKKSVRN